MSKKLSKLISCGHCSNISKMEIIGNVEDDDEYYEENQGPVIDSGTIYSVLECPACKKKNIVRYDWHDLMEPDEEIEYEILFPKDDKIPSGLPIKILNALKAAEKVKTIDVNAYAILLRRLLELVCLDRDASGDTLAQMLNDLAKKGEIPVKLVKVAKGLKDLGNVGAHASIGELSENETPIIKALTSAILEYIYSAPKLAEIAEEKLKSIKLK